MKVSSLKKQLNPSRNFSFSTPVCLKFNIPLVMDGVFLLKNILPNTVTLVFFDPQYRGVLDKLNYGNEGKRQILRKELLQMSETTIKEFIGLIDKVIKPSGHLFLWIDKFHFCEGISS
jgi:site-specific DNA-methyltransferase (adenine-specific)